MESCPENDDTEELEKELVVTTLEILVQTAINSLKDIGTKGSPPFIYCLSTILGDELEMIEFGKKIKAMPTNHTTSMKQASESTLETRQPRKATQYSGPMLSQDGKV